MKVNISILFLIVPLISFAQTPEITLLEGRKTEIQKQIFEVQSQLLTLNKELESIDSNIESLTNEAIIKEAEGKAINAIARKGAKLKREPLYNAVEFLTLNEATSIQVLGYKDKYFEICFEDKCGFMSELWIDSNPELEKFTTAINNKVIEDRIAKVQAEKESKKEYYIRRYGQSGYNKMLKGGYWTGMTTEQAVYTLGSPQKINNSVGSWGRHEQWIYSNGRYLYFDNGRLTSYQN